MNLFQKYFKGKRLLLLVIQALKVVGLARGSRLLGLKYLVFHLMFQQIRSFQLD